MTILVPFDGSDLSRKALEKAAELGDLRDETVLALSVIPDDESFARERGWINAGEPLRMTELESGLESRVAEIAPEATFRVETVDSDEPTATPTTNVVRTIRRIAGEIDASLVFVGSENAGSVIRPDTSVGGSVASGQDYDVYVVRKPE